MMGFLRSLEMSRILLILIEFYQKFISFDRGVLAILAPGGACRKVPTCSEYMKGQIRERGALLGLCFGIKRIFTCF